LFVGLIALPGFTFNKLQAVWFADLGAVQLAKLELKGFPANGWVDPDIVDQLDQADASLHTALELDPDNRTASHRLGLISAFRQDFSSAVMYLDAAYKEAPHHRGIKKSLGYSYAWLGEMDNAVFLLKEIPEAANELDAYFVWWDELGRRDLSNEAVKVRQVIESQSVQP
jgi:lipopolysaccharide biosynthesis regulator YciM